ncbi:MAG: MFS transporter [Halobacteriota archaeon]|nr:MFS transporter [Halobacteriota archaeon]
MRQRIFAILFLSVFATALGYGIISPLLPIYAETLGATGLWIGIIFAAFAATRAFFMPMFGRISDRYGRRNLIMIGLFAYSIFSLCYVWTSTVYSLTIVRLLHGLASAIVTPVSMAYIGDIVPDGKEGDYMGRFYTFFFVGFALGPLLAGSVTENYSLETSFYVMSGFGGIGFILSLLYLPESPSYKKTEHAPFGLLLKDSSMQGIVILRGVQSFGIAAFMSFLPIYSERIELTLFHTGLLLGITYIIWAILMQPFGLVADRYDKARLIIFGSIIMAISLSLIPLTSSFSLLLAIVLSRAIGGAIVLSSATAMATQIGREHGMGSTMGIFNTSMAAGLLFGGLISGLILDFLGMSAVFYMASIYYVIGIVVFWWLVEGRGS